MSRAVRQVAQAWTTESTKPGKEFGELVRRRRKERGLPVLSCEEGLPAMPIWLRQETSLPNSTLGPEELLVSWEAEQQNMPPWLHKRSAEQRMQEALRALEEAELRQELDQKLAWYEAQYLQELGTYTPACARYAARSEQDVSSE